MACTLVILLVRRHRYRISLAVDSVNEEATNGVVEPRQCWRGKLRHMRRMREGGGVENSSGNESQGSPVKSRWVSYHKGSTREY